MREQQGSSKQEALSSFISNNFTVRQCRRYVQVNFLKESIADLERKRFADEDCACGRSIEWHYDQNLTPRRPRGTFNAKPISLDDVLEPVYWDPGRDTLQKMCYCFGEIHFKISERLVDEFDPDGLLVLPAEHRAQYVRIEGRTEDDYLKKVSTLLLIPPLWELPEPGFIIDLMGEPHHWSPDLEQILVDKFANLITSANNDNIWIVTSGKNHGVGRIIGRAVARGRFERNDRRVICLGISSWASTAGRNWLESKLDPKTQTVGLWPADYEMNKAELVENYLEPNHDFFLLVDNGREISPNLNMSDQSIAFRSKLVDRLTDVGKTALSREASDSPHFPSEERTAENWLEKRTHFYNRTPSVLVVVGGGLSALESVRANLCSPDIGSTGEGNDASHLKSRPVLLLTAFGGLADLLAYVLQLPEPKPGPLGAKLTKKQKDEISEERANFERKIQKHPAFNHLLKAFIVGEERAKKEAEIMISLYQCLAKRRNISVLDVRTMESPSMGSPLFEAIFHAKQYSSKKTLELCLLLNEVDGARRLLEEVESIGLSHSTLDDFCSKTVPHIFERGLVDFYRLFTSFRYINKSNILSPTLAASLFENEFRRNAFLKLLLEDHHNKSLREVDSSSDTKTLSKMISRMFEGIVAIPNFAAVASDEGDEIRVRRDIFLLQLALTHNEMALELWRDGVDHLALALIAAVFLGRLSKKAHLANFHTLSHDYQTLANEWEQRGVDLLSVYGQMKQSLELIPVERLLSLSLRTSQGRCNALDVAYNGQLASVIAHDAVSVELKKLWHGRLSPNTPSLLIWPIAICPLLWVLLPFVKFVLPTEPRSRAIATDESDGIQVALASNSSEIDQLVDVELAPSCCPRKFEKPGSPKKIPFRQALRYFYSSPVCKFSTNLVSIICFVLLLSKVILSEISPGAINGPEIVAWIWSFTLFAHHLRPPRIAGGHKEAPNERFVLFYQTLSQHSIYVAQLLFVVAMALRWALFWDVIYARTLYAMVCLYFWLKLLEAGTVTRWIGTRAMTFRNLVVDFSFFLTLYVVCLFGFSISMYSLIWPDQPMSGSSEFLTLLINLAYNRWWSLFDQLKTGEFDGTDCTASVVTKRAMLGNVSTVINLFDSHMSMNSNECPTRNFVAVILYVVYLLVTNVILLNLLTALFTFTLQRANENSARQWSYNFYRVVTDFQNQMILPPPLNVFELCWEWLRFAQLRRRVVSEKVPPHGRGSGPQQKRTLIDVLQRAAANLTLSKPSGIKTASGKTNGALRGQQVERIKELGQKMDENLAKLNRKLADIERQQWRLSTKMTTVELFSSRSDGADSNPQSQNYA